MRLDPAAADVILEQFGARLDGGTLTILSGGQPADQLAIVRFEAVAFQPPSDGRMIAHDLSPTMILASGEARLGLLSTVDDEPLALLTVRSPLDPDAANADVVLERTAFVKGGLCAITSLSLTLPLQSP